MVVERCGNSLHLVLTGQCAVLGLLGSAVVNLPFSIHYTSKT